MTPQTARLMQGPLHASKSKLQKARLLQETAGARYHQAAVTTRKAVQRGYSKSRALIFARMERGNVPRRHRRSAV